MSPPLRRVVVDDTDSSFHYSSSWVPDSSGLKDGLGNFGPAFESSLHGTFSDGTFQFDFSGTSIEVVGTTDVKKLSSGATDPGWECFVDGAKIHADAPVLFPENNWSLCSTDGLQDSSHTLTVNVSSHRNPFWLDYVLYTPSAGASLDTSLVMIDDADADMHYDSNWENISNFVTLTETSGSSMSFNFTGVGVSWYGIYPKEFAVTPALASFAVDGSADSAFALKGLSPNSETLYHQLMFQTETLPYGPHTVTVKYLSERGSGTPLSLDYLVVNTGSSTSPSSTSVATTEASNPSSPTASPSSFSTFAVGKKHVSVVGVVLGVLFGLILLFVSAFLLYRHRKRKSWRVRESFTIASPYPRFMPRSQPREPATPQTINSTAALHGFSVSYPKAQNFTLASAPVSSPPRGPRQPPPRFAALQPQQQASGSNLQLPSQIETQMHEAGSEMGESENDSYYGGYQTWKDAKAQEAASGTPQRDSYI